MTQAARLNWQWLAAHSRGAVVWMTLLLAALLAGCAPGPRLLPAEEQKTVDRKFVEYPSDFELKPYVQNLTAPSAMAFDDQGTLLIAESGIGGREPHIFGYRKDGTRLDIYPLGRRFPLNIFKPGFRIYGPVGGMVAYGDKIYVSHRDENGRGVITAFGYDGSHQTVIADLPAQGDYGVTDLAIGTNDRLYFGVGTATNSGVVGLDNWAKGWVKKYPDTADEPWWNLKLLGYRFDTPNPRAGLFGPSEIAVTAPFQPFATSKKTWIKKAPNGKPNGAVYSISPNGGDLRIEAHGIRHPRGLAFNEFDRLYMTNQGMELRGTRPVKDDPDVLLRVVGGTWYGWPDYSADLQPISDTRFQPPTEMIMKSGYPDLSFLIDHSTTGLLRPDRNTLLQGTFQPLSGAAKLVFAPSSGPFAQFRGNAIVALSGDRAPFATSGKELIGPIGYKIVRVDVDNPMKQVTDFVRNTEGAPATLLEEEGRMLERPIDVKFGPDGALYILDFGPLVMKGGREKTPARGGKVYKLVGIAEETETNTK